MSGHIVGAFLVMEVCRITVDNQFGDVVFEVAAHVTVGIFGDDQRGTGVMHKYVTQPLLDIRIS